MRFFKVNLQDNRDVENMYLPQKYSEAMNLNYPNNMFVTVKDVPSSIPWHREAVICAGKKMY